MRAAPTPLCGWIPKGGRGHRLVTTWRDAAFPKRSTLHTTSLDNLYSGREWDGGAMECQNPLIPREDPTNEHHDPRCYALRGCRPCRAAWLCDTRACYVIPRVLQGLLEA